MGISGSSIESDPGIFHTTTDASAPPATGLGPFFVVRSLPTDGQACAGGDRGKQQERHA